MRAALTVEWWKVRRAPVVVVATGLQVLFVPLLGLAMVLVAGGDASGAVAAKADLLLTGDGWIGYFGVVAQVAAAAMFVGAGVVVAWVFGREHVEGTFAGLSATAVPRAAVALAKLVVVGAWALVVSLLVTVVAVLAGALAGVGPDPWAVVATASLRLLVVAVATTLLAVPVGWVASVGRGYLPAIGTVVVLVALAQIAVLLGGGAWFPFAVPGLLAVAGTEGVPPVAPIGVVLAVATVVAGAAMTLRWWRDAEVA